MLAIQLKNYLESVSDEANIMIFVSKTGEVRQLIMADLDLNQDGHIIIDAEYEVQPKHTIIRNQKKTTMTIDGLRNTLC